MAQARRCPVCGAGEIRDLACAGRRVPYRNIPDLEVPEDLAVPTCTACGEEFVNRDTARRMDEALTSAYGKALARKAEEALSKLSEVIAQRDLEPLLGLSAGYLSKVKSDRTPSSALVALLMSLAKEPNRVRELRDLWKTRIEVEEHGAQVIQLNLSARFVRPELGRWGPIELRAEACDFPGREAVTG